MKQTNLKLYVTDCTPNGTADLIITDEDGQLKGVLNESVFGLPCRPKDALGNINVLMYGEGMGLIEYDMDDQDMYEVILNGEISDFVPCSEVSMNEVETHLAVSPVKTKDQALEDLAKAISKAVRS